MASIRKRGSNSYLIVVSRGYDYEGNRLKSVQKTGREMGKGTGNSIRTRGSAYAGTHQPQHYAGKVHRALGG